MTCHVDVRKSWKELSLPGGWRIWVRTGTLEMPPAVLQRSGATLRPSCYWNLLQEITSIDGGIKHQTWRYYITIISSGWWFGTWMLFSPIVGMMIQSDFHIFRGGWNHQLVIGLCPHWRNYIPNNIGKVDSSGGFGLHRIHILHFGWSGSLSH
jgi:hypothetical protein